MRWGGFLQSRFFAFREYEVFHLSRSASGGMELLELELSLCLFDSEIPPRRNVGRVGWGCV